MSEKVRCISCGQFISRTDMAMGFASYHFEPDSDRGPEVSEWTCADCTWREMLKREDSQT